jgi:hypothetical protein
MTAQSVYLLIRRAVRDPNGAGSVPITASNAHTLDGERWTVQQMLDIYNIARRALVRGMKTVLSPEALRKRLRGFEISGNITWTGTVSEVTATQPNGYIMLVDEETGIRTSGGVPLRLRSNPGKLIAGNNPELSQSATDIYIFEVDKTFKHYGGFITNGQSTSIVYLGIADLTVADITTGTTTEEKILEEDIPLLIEVATMVARGVPIQDIEAYVAGKANVR